MRAVIGLFRVQDPGNPRPFSGGCARAATAFRSQPAIVPAPGLGNRCLHPCPASGSSAAFTEDLKRKKLAIALTAIAAFTAPAIAADMPVRAPVYQPPAPVYNWTGFWISGGGGGLWNADSNVVAFPSGLGITRDQRLGGSGWFGTVGAGWDWQWTSSWVFGIFGDGQFGEIRGSVSDPFNGIEGREKLRDSSLGCRPSARRWSIASTGVALPLGTDLRLRLAMRKAPESSGAFLLSRRQAVSERP